MLQALIPAALLVGVMWFVKLVELSTGEQYFWLGVFPRSVKGLLGIFTHPIVHGDMGHLMANTMPILVLGWMASFFYPKRFPIIFLGGWIITGIMVWIMARESWHIGASGLIYALAFFVFFTSIQKRNRQQSAIAFFTIFMYGGIIWGLLPGRPGVSFEAHIAGAVVGTLIAFVFKDNKPEVHPLGDMPEDEFKYRYRPNS